MEQHEIFSQAKSFFEDSLAVEQIVKRLPPGTRLKVVLDGRFEGQVHHDSGATRFSNEPLDPSKDTADFQIDLDSEALRRLAEARPSSLADLTQELVSLAAQRRLTIKSLVGPKSLLDKGYTKVLKDLGPLIQGEVAQAAMMGAGRVLGVVEDLKSRLGLKR
jgi:hypothetical protein